MPAGSLEQVVFRMDQLCVLHAGGMTVLNPPRAVEVCVDKYLTNVPHSPAPGCRPRGRSPASGRTTRWTAFADLGGDVVVKPLFGAEGRGMVRVTDREVAWRTFRAIEQTGGVIYLQEFVRHPGWDARAFVLGGRVLATMRRTNPDDWRTNASRGATVAAMSLDADGESLALAAAAAVGAEVAGVDLLPLPGGGWTVIEVNGVPGWQSLSAACEIDVARAIVRTRCGGATMTPLSECVRLACRWEARARKVGNVHPGASFANTTVEDFRTAAPTPSPPSSPTPRRNRSA